jgi:DNA repair exonuclease SbcCD ATPase subunit
MNSRRKTLSKFIDRLNKSIGRGDLPRAFRNQLASLREQTEAAEAEFQGLDARIKELEAQIEAQIKEREARIEVRSKEYEAQIKERERFCTSALPALRIGGGGISSVRRRESKANSRKQRSLKQMVHSVFGAQRGSDWRG